MLAVVKAPRTQSTRGRNFKVEGDAPEWLVELLKETFGDNVTISEYPEQESPKKETISIEDGDDEEYIDFEKTDLYREIMESTTPQENIYGNRDMRGWSQAMLAEKMGTSPKVISDLENGRRPISRKMAKRLGEAFGTTPDQFFRV